MRARKTKNQNLPDSMKRILGSNRPGNCSAMTIAEIDSNDARKRVAVVAELGRTSKLSSNKPSAITPQAINDVGLIIMNSKSWGWKLNRKDVTKYAAMFPTDTAMTKCRDKDCFQVCPARKSAPIAVIDSSRAIPRRALPVSPRGPQRASSLQRQMRRERKHQPSYSLMIAQIQHRHRAWCARAE